MTFGGSLVVGTLCVSDCSKRFHLLLSYHWTCLHLQKLLFGSFVSAESRSGMISKATMASVHHCMIKNHVTFTLQSLKWFCWAIMCYGLDLYPFPTQCFASSPKAAFVCVGGLWGIFFLNAAAALGMLVKSQVSLQLWNGTIQPQDSKQ